MNCTYEIQKCKNLAELDDLCIVHWNAGYSERHPPRERKTKERRSHKPTFPEGAKCDICDKTISRLAKLKTCNPCRYRMNSKRYNETRKKKRMARKEELCQE